MTSPFLMLMAYFAWGSLNQVPPLVEALTHLGYPPYVLSILGIANALGVVAIIYGRLKVLKEWSYAGVTFNLMAASISHYFIQDHNGVAFMPIIFLIPVIGSYYLWCKSGKTF
ncbi:hypothetical protein D3C72_1413870 [compost metagenome]